jgi:bifunctional non-homologous end joining protein LigD
MLANPISELPEGANWQYEIKLDCYRALAIKDKAEARLLSHRNNALNDRFPTIANAL